MKNWKRQEIGHQFLVVEDDYLSRIAVEKILSPFGTVLLAKNVFEAKTIMANFPLDMAFIDLKLERTMGGLDLIEIANSKGIHSVILSGYEESKYIEDAYQRGCKDYLVKPFNPEILPALLKKLDSKGPLKDISFTLNDPPILLVGETGTGKSRLARQIHREFFKDAPFVEMACAEIPETLLESELFGFEKGAFSGANNSKPGRLELANGGILFLDEVATMPLTTQKKLLKAIEEKKFFRLGGTSCKKTQFFLISATSDNLTNLVKEGKFRRDLYYRLEGHVIERPPLRKDKEHIPLLVEQFLKRGSRRVVLTKEVWQIFYNYNWPGNIRELSHTIDILRKHLKGIITQEDLPDKFKEVYSMENPPVKMSCEQMEFIEQKGLKSFLKAWEENVVLHFLKKNDKKVRKTTRQLQISNNVFYKIMERINAQKYIQSK